MMNMKSLAKPMISTSKAIWLSLTAATLIWHNPVSADDLQIVPERSKGAEVSRSDNKLAASETLTLAAKGRVWAVKQQGDQTYNLICMNQAETPLTLQYFEDSQPWLRATSNQCKQQGEHLYSCTDAAQNPTLMCRAQLAPKQTASAGVTDMTAVALRSLDNSDEAFYRIANSVMEQHKLHFELCQDMHGQHNKGGVSFVIQASGAIENVAVIKDGELATPELTEDYAQCIAQAIELWRFPTLDYIYEMEYAFVN